MIPVSQLHRSETQNLVMQNQKGRVPAPSRMMYMMRKSAVDVNTARVTLPIPFFLMEKESLRAMISSPRNILIIHFLANAHGSSAAALSPSRPSASQSTVSPLAKAMKRHES